jgi:hypothetical protein
MANIELDGANKKIKVDSGDLTLDVPGDIVLDADGGDIVFADGGTNLLKVTNSSSDVVLQPQVDTKDIIFKQYDGTVVATVEDNATFNIPASKLAIGGTAVTSTAAELNLLDGGTSVGGSITLADADGIVTNDGGTMKTIPASDIKTYAGFTATTITGTTALAAQPASDDEIIISDAGTLKRLDIKHIQNTPAFSANKTGSDQSLSGGGDVKVEYNVEILDSDSAYDNSTNFRFTPGVAGKYYFQASAYVDTNAGAGTLTIAGIKIKKNGSTVAKQRTNLDNNNGRTMTQQISCVLDMDADDYVEAFAHGETSSGAGQIRQETDGGSNFMGFRIAGV